MRIDLRVPYAQKDAAKALGARWDAARKLWYVVDPPDLSALADWLPPGGLEASTAVPPSSLPLQTVPVSPGVRAGVFTGPKAFTAVCDCAVLPWEPCAHSAR